MDGKVNIRRELKMEQNQIQATIIYYDDESLELRQKVKFFPKNQNGRIIISEEFKNGKSIVAVCKGEVKILNKVGERLLPVGQIA